MRPPPSDIASRTVKLLQDKIGAGASTEVLLIPIRQQAGEPADGAEATAPNACHDRVARRVAADGGERVHGWLIWELPAKYIEGVFHSVWKTPAGGLVDISPHEAGKDHIAFLPDSRVRWEGVPVPSHRLALVENRWLERSIAIADATDRHEAEASRENGAPVQIELEELFKIHRRQTRHSDPCMCRSGQKYKKCCEGLSPKLAMAKWLKATNFSGRRVEAAPAIG